MGDKKKINISDNSDEENLDLKTDQTEAEQDEWAEQLDEEVNTDNSEEPDTASDSEVTEISDDSKAIENSEDSVTSHEGQDQAPEPEDSDVDEINPIDDVSQDEDVSEPEDISEAVDSIVREESDVVIKAEDDARLRFNPPDQKKSLVSRFKILVVSWWQNKRLRYSTIGAFLAAVIIALFIPYSRYTLLNIAGVRVKSSLVVIDVVSGRPLKNIQVSLQGKESRSDGDGNVSFTSLKQGNTVLKIDKRGYAPFEKNITLGWGSNPIGEQGITATGAQYKFVVTDWLSGKPLIDAEATAGEDIGQSDEKGNITLTVGEDVEDSEVTISAKNYRDEKLKLSDLNQSETAVKMVVGKKHAFVSNRSGEYDLYAIDVDGKNEKLLLKATGKEREVPFVLPHQTREYVAYISSRDGDINKGNFILDGLFVANTTDGDVYKVTRSEQLQLIGWVDNKLIFVAVIEGTSAGNSQRSKLISYDLDTKERKDLATSNYFNDVKIVGDSVYYSISSYAVPASQAKLFSIKSDGTEKKTVVDTQVWSIIRKNYDTLLLNATDLQWFEKIGSEDAKKLDSEPAQKTQRIYSDSPDKMNSLWVDVRDGKGVLLRYQTTDKKEDVIKTASGLSDPVYWLDDAHFVYRVTTSQETADYVMSLDGGESQKIADVLGNRSRYFY